MIAQEVSLPGRQKEEMIDIPDELTGGEQHVKVTLLVALRHSKQTRNIILFIVVWFFVDESVV